MVPVVPWFGASQRESVGIWSKPRYPGLPKRCGYCDSAMAARAALLKGRIQTRTLTNPKRRPRCSNDVSKRLLRWRWAKGGRRGQYQDKQRAACPRTVLALREPRANGLRLFRTAQRSQLLSTQRTDGKSPWQQGTAFEKACQRNPLNRCCQYGRRRVGFRSGNRFRTVHGGRWADCGP